MPHERIIKQREHVTVTEYCRYYEWKDCKGAGFSFDCDEKGHIDESKMYEAGIENLRMCEADNGEKLIDHGLQTRKYSYWEEAVLRCDCGHEMSVSPAHDNECDKCGRLYNGFGQQLKSYNDPTRYDDVDWAMEQEALDYERMEADFDY